MVRYFHSQEGVTTTGISISARCVYRAQAYTKGIGKGSDSVLRQKPSYQRKIKTSIVTTQKRAKNFDNATISDRLKTVSLSDDSHPTGMV